MLSQYENSNKPATSKTDLRTRMREVRQQLDDHTRVAGAQRIVDRLHQIITRHNTQKVGLYLATTYEVNLDALIDCCKAEGRDIYLPHLSDSQKPFRKFETWNQIEMGPLNLRHPSLHAPALGVQEFDMVVLPGLAFDRQGNRLGHGGGWYDRALQDLQNDGRKPILVGVCFDEQLISSFPIEPFDVRMNMVITPSDVLQLN